MEKTHRPPLPKEERGGFVLLCVRRGGDRGRERRKPSPPSEPCGRFSRTRLSSRQFPHRDWLAGTWLQIGDLPLFREERFLDLVAEAANMRSIHRPASTHSRYSRDLGFCLLFSVKPRTHETCLSWFCSCMAFTLSPSCPSSLGLALLSRLFTSLRRFGTIRDSDS